MYTPIVLNNLREGLRQDADSFILPNDASPSLLNISYFRGRLVEKGGEELFCKALDAGYRGRLGARNFSSSTDGSGDIPSGTVFLSGSVSPNTILITQGPLQAIDDGQGNFVDFEASGWSGTGTFDYATGTTSSAITGFSVSSSYDVFLLREVDEFSPVMALATREINVINREELFAFDRLKPYRFSAAQDRFNLQDNYAVSNATFSFSGSNSDFFWYSNYKDGFWVSNNVPGFDAIQDVSAVATGSTTTITFTSSHVLQVDDWVFLWDMQGVTFPKVNGVYVTSGQVINIPAANEIEVSVVSSGTYTSGGTVQSITRQIGTGDGIKWYDPDGWRNFSPPITGANPPLSGQTAEYLFGALIILPYKGFQLCLSTWEGPTYSARVNRQQRARWSQNGTPYYSGPAPSTQGVDTFAWLQTQGRGGFIDAPTQEQIVSCDYIRDTLVVFFETSTWTLDFTNDLLLPFIWRQVNKDYGSESTFSTVTFDKAMFTVAEDGIMATDGVNMERIDQKIPDQVYAIANNDNGSMRVHGQINFVSQNVKWCYPDPEIVFPNKELVYNFLDKSWAMNEGFHTCFVKYERFYNLTWGEARFAWAEGDFAWNGFDENDGDTITLGGNSQGFIHELPAEQITTQSNNDRQFRVTSIVLVDGSYNFTVPNHSFTSGQFVFLTGMGSPNDVFNDKNYKLQVVSSTQVKLIDSGGAVIAPQVQETASGYLSQVTNLIFQTKRFYAGNEQGLQCRLGYVDFLFTPSSTYQEMTVELYIDEFDTASQTRIFGLLGATKQGTPEPTQSKIMKRVYFNSQGTSFSLKLYYSDAAMFASSSADKQFVLHQFVPYVKTTGRMVRQPVI